MKKIHSSDPLENILYITLPEDYSEVIGDFTIDPKIMLPIDPPEGEKEWKMEDLSWEQIVSAMLKILAYQPDHEDASYFRDFVFAVRPNIITELTNSAVIKAQDKEFDLAEEIFLALRGLDAHNPVLHLNLALLYEQRWEQAKARDKKEDEELYAAAAEAAFKETADREDPPHLVWYYMGLFYYRRGMYKLAGQNLETYAHTADDADKVEEAERLAAEIRNMKLEDEIFQEAYQDIKGENVDEGLDKIKTFLEHNPDVWNGWFLLGWGMRKKGDFETAKKCFAKAIEKGKPNDELYNELAICDLELGNLDESRKWLNKALTLAPENMKTVSNMGLVSLKQGKLDEAKAFFQTALEIEPGDKIALQYLKLIESGQF